MAASDSSAPQSVAKLSMSILIFISACHFVNDVMQSLLVSLYPLLKANYHLDFFHVGLLTLAYQATASLLQPMIGYVTDRKPMPYSLPASMLSTGIGLVLLAHAHSFAMLLVGACLIGTGSAIFHPEASRVTRLASGGRFGFAQSVFQVGGNGGGAIGPLLAAYFVLPFGQSSVSWAALGTFAGFVMLLRVSAWYARFERRSAKTGRSPAASPLPKRTIIIALSLLVFLQVVRATYSSSLNTYLLFYTMTQFSLDGRSAQMVLFLFLAASAVGTLLGGPISDRFGYRFTIWFSIIGTIPFALALPYADLTWTYVLVAVIGLIFASSHAIIVVFAQELIPSRVGTIAGVFFGLSFGAGGLTAAALGYLADFYGIVFIYAVCSWMPLLCLVTLLLPRLPSREEKLG
ncbi:MAG: MFS transporter [Methylobacteriaceae bacterium]|jgi:FSR family fosmidomycin resistance protein-like MFS transporter|nr:MFS transporter [Methylobacteriaceae bacterium]